MPNFSDVELQALTDSSWKEGFEAGLRVKQSFSKEDLRDLIAALQSILDNDGTPDVPDEPDDEVEVDLHIGDFVEIEPGEFYMICKIEGDTIVAVDPKHRRLISSNASDIISVGKLHMALKPSNK